MNVAVGTLAGLLAFWMAACCFCGLHRRFVAFLAILFVGLAANMCWMVFGLQARPFEVDALIAQGSVVLYAFCAFGAGWFAGRIRRAWQESSVERTEV